MCLLGGEPLEDALAALNEKDVPLISVMHTEVGHIDACLDILNTHWHGAVGVYAHVCQFSQDDTTAIFDDMISPADYAQASKRWMDQGVQLIGGCCGVRKEHICELRQVV